MVQTANRENCRGLIPLALFSFLSPSFDIGRASTKRNSTFKGTCSDPPPLSPLSKKEKIYLFFSSFFINISLEPVLRLGVTIQTFFFNNKGFSGPTEYIYVLSQQNRHFLTGRGVYPSPWLDRGHFP